MIYVSYTKTTTKRIRIPQKMSEKNSPQTVTLVTTIANTTHDLS